MAEGQALSLPTEAKIAAQANGVHLEVIAESSQTENKPVITDQPTLDGQRKCDCLGGVLGAAPPA